MDRVFLRFAPSRPGHPPWTHCETLTRPTAGSSVPSRKREIDYNGMSSSPVILAANLLSRDPLLPESEDIE